MSLMGAIEFEGIDHEWIIGQQLLLLLISSVL